MNNLQRKIATIFVAIFFISQNCHGAIISNGNFLNYHSSDSHETLSYDIEVEVLEKPISIPYNLDSNNFKILNILKDRGYEAILYNYLSFEEGDTIQYPFRIKQTYTIKNTKDSTIYIPISYFPLNRGLTFVHSYPFKDNIIQIGENYGIRNSMILQDNILVHKSKKYTVFSEKYSPRSTGNNNMIYNQKIIELEENWNIQIKAGETSTLVFSYYATDLPINDEHISEDNYARYNFGSLGVPEPLFVPNTHSLILPAGYLAISTHSEQKTIYGPYTGEVLMNQFGDLKIYKNNN